MLLNKFDRFYDPARSVLRERLLGAGGMLGELNQRTVGDLAARGQLRAPVSEYGLAQNRGAVARAAASGEADLFGKQAGFEANEELARLEHERKRRLMQEQFKNSLWGDIAGLGAGAAGAYLKKRFS